jgi:hypothetical protein
MHFLVGLAAVIGLIAFAFGEGAAVFCVRLVLVVGGLGFAFIVICIAKGLT